MLQASHDLVDRIFEYVVKLCPEISADHLDELKHAAREGFCGERCYINDRSRTDMKALVAEVLLPFNGRNPAEVARLYIAISNSMGRKSPEVSKNRLQFAPGK